MCDINGLKKWVSDFEEARFINFHSDSDISYGNDCFLIYFA